MGSQAGQDKRGVRKRTQCVCSVWSKMEQSQGADYMGMRYKVQESVDEFSHKNHRDDSERHRNLFHLARMAGLLMRMPIKENASRVTRLAFCPV
jgi:hypothetical protein